MGGDDFVLVVPSVDIVKDLVIELLVSRPMRRKEILSHLDGVVPRDVVERALDELVEEGVVVVDGDRYYLVFSA